MWLLYAFLSALGAAGVAIFAKLGLQNVDSTLATIIRSIIMAVFLVLVGLTFKKFDGFTFASLSNRDWILIVFSGLAGALSWLFYFLALKTGPATKVVVIDRTSLIFVVLLAALFLGEKLNLRVAAGAVIMVAGALLITLK